MPPLARTNSRPTFGKPANRFISRGCFGSNGEVWCFCNTEPRVEALRRVTRKESSPNLGRDFYSCGNWQEPKCEMFLWVDESAQKGRQNVTPPPEGGSTSNHSAPPPPRPTTPARAAPTRSTSAHPSPSKRPRSPPPQVALSSSPRRPLPASEKLGLEDIDFENFSNDLSEEEGEGEEEEIDDPDTEPEPDTQTQGSSSVMSSPTKKPRFTSFGGGTGEVKGGNGGYGEIKNDPDSPFHSIKRNLFGGAGEPDRDGAAPSSSPLANASSTHPTTSTSTERPTATDSLTSLTQHLEEIPLLLTNLKKDQERDQRLIEVGKKKEEMWKKKNGKLEGEMDVVKRENEVLKEKVRRLEEEVRELRTRR
ncbi:hypothetical protein JCM16303_007327 [Sporobolomyces ruberrimus]